MVALGDISPTVVPFMIRSNTENGQPVTFRLGKWKALSRVEIGTGGTVDILITQEDDGQASANTTVVTPVENDESDLYNLRGHIPIFQGTLVKSLCHSVRRGTSRWRLYALDRLVLLGCGEKRCIQRSSTPHPTVVPTTTTMYRCWFFCGKFPSD